MITALELQENINLIVREQAYEIENLVTQYIRWLRDPVLVAKYDENGAMIIHCPGDRETVLARVDIAAVTLEDGKIALQVIRRLVASKAELESLCDLSTLPEDLH